MTIDGLWCAIGSSNFDDRSFEINDEITLGLVAPALARELEAIFERDMRECTELELSTWKQRSRRHKLLDRAFYLLREQL
jgi:cardiolipin synthase